MNVVVVDPESSVRRVMDRTPASSIGIAGVTVNVIAPSGSRVGAANGKGPVVEHVVDGGAGTRGAPQASRNTREQERIAARG